MISRQRNTHGLGTLLALAALAAACSSSSDTTNPGTGGAGGTAGAAGAEGGAPIVDAFSADITLTCSENPWSGVYTQGSAHHVSVNALSDCNLDAKGVLFAKFGTGFNTITINIAAMTGPATYKTDNTEANEVSMVGDTTDNPSEAWSVGAPAGIGPPPDEKPYPAREYPCTIVVQTNLLNVTRSHDGPVPFGIAFDVTCARLGGAANFPVDCDLAPATFHLAVAACNASAI